MGSKRKALNSSEGLWIVLVSQDEESRVDFLLILPSAPLSDFVLLDPGPDS